LSRIPKEDFNISDISSRFISIHRITGGPEWHFSLALCGKDGRVVGDVSLKRLRACQEKRPEGNDEI
jgi:hypothetical protein